VETGDFVAANRTWTGKEKKKGNEANGFKLDNFTIKKLG